jgi:hypothetical protein
MVKVGQISPAFFYRSKRIHAISKDLAHLMH